MAMSKRIRAFVEHPLTKLLVGIVLLSSGLSEVYEEIEADLHSRVRAHHGVVVLGFINILAAMPDLLEGLAKGAEVLEDKHEGAGEGRASREGEE